MNNKVYLDNAATTLVDVRVLEEMWPYFSQHFGNASSLHFYGTTAKEAVDSSRMRLANLLKCKSDEIVFTSSGTEANNLALKGIAFANRSKGNHIIVSEIEHDCVLNTCKWLEEQGFFVTYIPVKKNGIVDLEFLKKCINKKTILVSVMHVNNEIGTVQPISQIGQICAEHGVYFHTDACQSFGKIPIEWANIDLLTINSHKIFGPKGIGALVVKQGIKLVPLLHGGGQEAGIRSSTENVPAIVGFAKAAELCFEEMEAEYLRLGALQKEFIQKLNEKIDGIYFNGDLGSRIPHNINFCIEGLEGESIRLLLLLGEQNIAVSSGSACSSNATNPASHVLQALGLNPFEARGSIRISMGRNTTPADVDTFVSALALKIKKLNSIFSYVN